MNPNDPRSYILFSTEKYEYMKKRIHQTHPLSGDGEVERKTFPDGERYQRIATDVMGMHAVIVGGTISDTDTLELYDMACAIAKYGARRLTIVIPYFGYSTMERSTKHGEVVTAKTRARLLSAIPWCPDGRFPRTRGDRPSKRGCAGVEATVPPHTRGSTHHAWLRDAWNSGSPAHAGIDLPKTKLQVQYDRFPRTRGDRPWKKQFYGSDFAVPPHTRGYDACFYDKR